MKTAIALSLSLLATAANATVIDFEDITVSKDPAFVAAIPTSYAGLTWSEGWGVGSSDFILYENAASNGTQFGQNAVDSDLSFPPQTVSISSDTAFTFYSASFSAPIEPVFGSYQRSAAQTLTVDFYNGETLLTSETFNVNASSQYLLSYAGGLTGVTSIDITTLNESRFFTMDAFTYEAPVPVPAAALLFGTGIAGISAFARRKKA